MKKIITFLFMVVFIFATAFSVSAHDTMLDRAKNMIGDLWVGVGYGADYAGAGFSLAACFGFGAIGISTGYYPNGGLWGYKLFTKLLVPPPQLPAIVAYLTAGIGTTGTIEVAEDEYELGAGFYYEIGVLIGAEEKGAHLQIGFGRSNITSEDESYDEQITSYSVGIVYFFEKQF